MAIRAGASALGLVSSMPSGPGVIGENVIAEVAAATPPPVSTFLLTSLQGAAEIAAQQRRLRTTTIQICDRLTRGSHADLRALLPGIGLVQVVHVTGPESVEEAVAVAPAVDALLLDSGNQSLAVKELGGTGRRHDWSVSRQIREASLRPDLPGRWSSARERRRGHRGGRALRPRRLLGGADRRSPRSTQARGFLRRRGEELTRGPFATPVLGRPQRRPNPESPRPGDEPMPLTARLLFPRLPTVTAGLGRPGSELGRSACSVVGRLEG